MWLNKFDSKEELIAYMAGSMRGLVLLICRWVELLRNEGEDGEVCQLKPGVELEHEIQTWIGLVILPARVQELLEDCCRCLRIEPGPLTPFQAHSLSSSDVVKIKDTIERGWQDYISLRQYKELIVDIVGRDRYELFLHSKETPFIFYLLKNETTKTECQSPLEHFSKDGAHETLNLNKPTGNFKKIDVEDESPVKQRERGGRIRNR